MSKHDFEDETLGKINFSSKLNMFVGKVEWMSESIDLLLNTLPSQLENMRSCIETAHQLWQEKKSWNSRAIEFAAAELLPTKNESWLEEGEKKMSQSEFKKRLSLRCVNVFPDGGFQFWFECGSLFAGHDIQVSGNIESGLEYADIPG